MKDVILSACDEHLRARLHKTNSYVGIYAEGKSWLLHRYLLRPEIGMHVDHINGNRLDNRRENLRVCTHSQNHMNKSSCRGRSKYKGAYWWPQKGKWKSSIKVNGKDKYLGLFLTEEDAAKAYNQAALKHYGEFARLNNV